LENRHCAIVLSGAAGSAIPTIEAILTRAFRQFA